MHGQFDQDASSPISVALQGGHIRQLRQPRVSEQSRFLSRAGSQRRQTRLDRVLVAEALETEVGNRKHPAWFGRDDCLHHACHSQPDQQDDVGTAAVSQHSLRVPRAGVCKAQQITNGAALQDRTGPWIPTGFHPVVTGFALLCLRPEDRRFGRTSGSGPILTQAGAWSLAPS